jgi:hypothetical protein
MNHPTLPPDQFSMDELVMKIQTRLGDHEGGPTGQQIRDLCELLYRASLLKEEGRVVRARVILAPPEAFSPGEGPPDGTHAVRFTVPHNLTANEIKRLSPAASFFHSVIAVWPDRDRGLRIWGILNTGPRWLNLVAGGRKSLGKDMPHPIIHVRDPGWLLFYHGYALMAEWRGREFHGPRMDVFHSRLLNDRLARNVAASPIGIAEISAMLRSPIVTARLIGLSRAPWHE